MLSTPLKRNLTHVTGTIGNTKELHSSEVPSYKYPNPFEKRKSKLREFLFLTGNCLDKSFPSSNKEADTAINQLDKYILSWQWAFVLVR